jgi:predicted ATP-grasp superfamily ATP-dependent carboligase
LDAGRTVLIFGASARAAAFSALRAGLQPWCADLFADADLRCRCPTIRVPADVHPRGFRHLIIRELPGPWLYTGALENAHTLVLELARLRPLWGNTGAAIASSRTPWFVAWQLAVAEIPCPAVYQRPAEVPRHGRWLVKPLAGAGGRGIRFLDSGPPPERARGECYVQEYVEGTPCAAVYVGDGRRAGLLGATRQLVGEPWLHAAPFHYCGSVGPLPLTTALRQRLEQLGTVLADGCPLRGLFGVDFILRDDVPWPLEVNPRYTASVEVLEYAAGIPALALHRRIFDPAAPEPAESPPAGAGTWLGKAILFAPRALTFPEEGPWQAALDAPPPLWEAPAFADIPAAGQHIAAGRPVLTFFARAATEADCLARLRATAADLDSRLFTG